MEQRRLRLGDILDDYCSRERRVTNHVVVAMIEEEVKQTRCTTCDAEHAYKGGREPRRRGKKDAPGALYREVLAGMPDADPGAGASTAAAGPPAAAPDVVPVPPAAIQPQVPPAQTTPAAAVPLSASAADSDEDETPGQAVPVEEGPVHRRLIRATLPRQEGQLPEARPVHEFTMRQNNGRGQFRGGDRMRAPAAGNGSRPPGPRRFGSGGSNPGMPGRGPAGRGAGGGGFRGPNNNAPRQGGGKKRSR